MATAPLLITIGLLFLAGLALDAIGRLTHVPRISLLVLFGLLIGPAGAGILPDDVAEWQDLAANLALTMVAFLLGGELSRAALAAHGRAILAVSISVTLATLVVIATGMLAIGVALAPALLLAGIGLATDPAATRDVVRETRADGPFSRTILGVVAIDDAWGVIAFSILLGAVTATSANGWTSGVADGLLEVFGAAAVGAAVGLPAAYATGRIRPGEPTQAEALGVVLLTAGLSLWLEVSFLIAGMTAGVMIVNLARHHDYAFHEIEHVSWPFLILFFVLAGAAVRPDAILEAGALGVAFVVLRLGGRFVGGWIGGRLGGLAPRQSALIGFALTPQAGVALGMALVAGEAAPDLAEELITVAVGTMLVFELFGPIATRWALRQSGEAGKAPPPDAPPEP